MSTTLYELGRWCYRHARRVLALWLGAAVLLGLLAFGIGGKFDDSFTIPGTESQTALDQLSMTFPQAAGTAASVIVAVPDGHTVDEPEVREAIDRMVTDLEQVEHVDLVTSPYSDLITGLINGDRTAAMINISIGLPSTEITDESREQLLEHGTEYQRWLPDAQVEMGGQAFSVEIPSLSAVEAIGILVALVVLLLTLGSMLAAGMPLLTAILGVGISMLILLVATGLTTINSTVPMLAVMLGLAVGIDYALFIISRHREQLGHGMATEESAARAVATAGSAVVFAGTTVIIALVGLGVAGVPFITVMGIFAAIAVAMAVCIALTLLPALLGMAGERLRPKVRTNKRALARAEKLEAARAAGEPRPGLARAWVGIVTRVPWLTIVIVVVGLGALAIPAKDLHLALPNSGQHEATAPDRITYDLTEEKFGPGFNGPLIITGEIIQSTDPLGLADDLKTAVEAVPGVDRVLLATPNENADTVIVQVIPAYAPDDQRTADVVEELRNRQPEWERTLGIQTAVTGMTAVQIDISTQLGNALLPFGIFVVGLSLILLTMVFRSIAVPLKATLGFLLSVGAAFGATTIVFNYGIGRELINLEQPMAVISFLPILLMGILFGLAMDYEVFLVSRMREEYAHGKSAREAIRHGFVGSSTVVVAAAVIMFAVFAFFVPEGMGAIKAIAFGLAVGVMVDAFLVRMTLVPAVLQLLGDKAWWLPRWLDRVLPSFDAEGESLAHVLAERNWPSAEDTHVVITENLTVNHREEPLFAGVDLRLQAGEVLLVQAPAGPRAALLLGLAGRLKELTGRAKVAGLVLPEEAGKARRRVAYLSAPSTDQLDRALARTPELLIIDDADALTDSVARGRVADLTARDDITVILGVADAARADDLLAAEHYRIELIPPDRAPRTPESPLTDSAAQPDSEFEGATR